MFWIIVALSSGAMESFVVADSMRTISQKIDTTYHLDKITLLEKVQMEMFFSPTVLRGAP